MDEFSLQKANRFQCEQVVDQEGVGVFQCTDDTPTTQDRGDACIYIASVKDEYSKLSEKSSPGTSLPVGINTCL